MNSKFHLTPQAAAPPLTALPLHDALPISGSSARACVPTGTSTRTERCSRSTSRLICPCTVRRDILIRPTRSEENTSELQSRGQRVCRLPLDKKKNNNAKRAKRLVRETRTV